MPPDMVAANVRGIAKRLRAPEPAVASIHVDPVRAELEILKIRRRQGAAGVLPIFQRAYGDVVEEYLDRTQRILRVRDVELPAEAKTEWRDHIGAEFFRLVAELEDQWLEEEALRGWFNRLREWCPSGRRSIINKRWQRRLLARNEDGKRYSLKRIVEELATVCCTMMMAYYGPQP